MIKALSAGIGRLSLIAHEKDEHLCSLSDLPLNYFQTYLLMCFQRNIHRVLSILLSLYFSVYSNLYLQHSILFQYGTPPVTDPFNIEFSHGRCSVLGSALCGILSRVERLHICLFVL